MSSWVGKFHDFTKKYDPLGHALVDAAWKTSTKTVNESSRAMVKAGDKLGVNTDIPEYGRELSQKDKNSFSRWGENTLGSVAALWGAGAAAGAMGGGSAGTAAGTGAAAEGGTGAALGGTGAAAGGGSGATGAFGASGVPWAGGVDAGAGGASGLGYAEAGGGFVGNGAAGGGAGNSAWFSGSGSGFNSSLAQQGAKGLGNKSTQSSDSGAIQRQLALAELMRKHKEEQDAAGDLPGWVNMA
jgi:hypothetical protein